MKANLVCPNCKGRLVCVCTKEEFMRAKLIPRTCTQCGHHTYENLPVKGHKPPEKFRDQLRRRAQQMGKDVKAGRVRYRNGYWFPVDETSAKFFDASRIAETPIVNRVHTIELKDDPPPLTHDHQRQLEFYKEATRMMGNPTDLPSEKKPFIPSFDDE